jgi:HK97 family phage portal protein
VPDAIASRLSGARRRRRAAATAVPMASGQSFSGLDDPALLEFIRTGRNTISAFETSAVVRCIDLRAGAIGMLPLRLMRKPAVGGGVVAEASDHALFDLLMYEPNAFQTAYEFKRLMEMRVLAFGDAFARIVRTGQRIAGLLPIDPDGVGVEVQGDGRLLYRFTQKNRSFDLPQEDVFHLRGFSVDGVRGLSMLKLAAEAIGLSREASSSLFSIYRSGMAAGGALMHPSRLGPEAKNNLKQQLEEYSGSRNRGRFLVLDEGIKVEHFQQTAKDAQTIETARHQVEEIARFFGVPRPLMGMDDTSWGSGVEQLAILFVRFGLAPSFVNWEQAIRRSLLTREEKRRYEVDFDERELLRGSMKDQAEFFAKASGSGGHKPWMQANEIRELTGLRPLEDGFGLAPPGVRSPTPAPAQE